MYIRIDNACRVIEVYEYNYTGLIFVDWKPKKSLMDERNVYRYKYTDGVITERTQEEMDADYAARPAPPPSDKERITALEDALTAIEEGIASV